MRRVWIGIFVAVLATTSVGHAQNRDETLADIRQEMSVLYVELQKLKRELSTTGGVSDTQRGRDHGVGAPGGGAGPLG